MLSLSNADYKLEQCLDCICEGKYDCSITKPFWQDGGSHGGNYEMCIKFTNDWCAKATMKQYYHRFKKVSTPKISKSLSQRISSRIATRTVS